jgi:hypothetical protein
MLTIAPRKIFQSGRAEWPVGAVDKAFHIVVMVMVVAAASVFGMRGMVAVLTVEGLWCL